ncbi:MAG: hypothetical protein ABJP45_03935 [Cyclobacteriaceae bacterium]
MINATTIFTNCVLFCCFFFSLFISGCSTLGYEESYDSAQTAYGKLNPNAPAETIQWGQFAGKWDCISRDLVDSIWYENKATWKWEYILGGHAILNEWWQEDTSPNPPSKEYYATGVFIVNRETKLWEAVVLNTRPHKISSKFEAEYKDSTIQMHDGTGTWLVTFYDITKDSFEWKYEVLRSKGVWSPISTISATRRL